MEQPPKRTAAGNAAKGGAAATTIALILAGVYSVEGGYVNSRNDPGGATNYGITEQVARRAGYAGNMKAFPKHCDGPAHACADDIYVSQYIEAPGYMPLVTIEPAVAHKLVDTAVNMGPGRPTQWFRESLGLHNVGKLGPADYAAYQDLQARVGALPACKITLRILDVKQDGEYRRLVARNPKLKVFLKGWLANRVGNVKPSECGGLA